MATTNAPSVPTPPTRADLHRLVDELPEDALRSLADLLEDVDDAAASRRALDEPERVPYEQVRRELGLG